MKMQNIVHINGFHMMFQYIYHNQVKHIDLFQHLSFLFNKKKLKSFCLAFWDLQYKSPISSHPTV